MPATALAEAASRAAGPAHVPHRWARRVFPFGVLPFSAVLALILVAVPHSMADPDIWWHLLNARQMLAQHAFVRHDALTFTAAGAPWIDHEWLAELPFYLCWRAAGAAGVYLLTAMVIGAIFAVLLLLCRRASQSWPTAGLVTVGAAFVSTISFGPRTLLFGWLCLVLQLAVLEGSRRRPARLLLLAPLYLLWVNLHGSWMIGLTLLLVFSVAGMVWLPAGAAWIAAEPFAPRERRMLLLAWLGILPALFCNPWGWRLVLYPFNFAYKQTLNVANVEEWQSMDLHSLRGRLVIVAVGLAVGRQLWRPRRWTLPELLFCGIGLYSAACYARFMFLFALLAAPSLARSFARRAVPRPEAASAKPLPNAALLALILLLLGADFRRNVLRGDPEMVQFPAAALPAVARLDPHRRLFNAFLWGGYLEWMQPGRPVFIDSRVDLFEYNGSFRDYLDIIHIQNSLALLDRYRIDYVLFERDTPLVYLLERTPGWQVRFSNGREVLLERTGPR